MEEEKLTTIFLSSEEAELFKKFRQYQSIWQEVFNIRGGSVVLHFDLQGNMREVEYTKKSKIEFASYPHSNT